MIAQERYNKILEYLDTEGTVTVAQLTALLGASEATIRRDLGVLAKDGKLNKVFGGATSVRRMGLEEESVSRRETIKFEEKDAIGRYAASLVRDEDFVFIDSGTTTACMIPYLTNTKATYVTNGVLHAYRLLQAGLTVHLIGGKLRPSTEAAVGAEGLRGISNFNFTKAFMGTNGITVGEGFTTPDVEEAAMKGGAIGRSFISFVLADHTKFNRAFSVTFAPLSACCILTDRMPKDKKYSESTIIKEVSR